MDNEIPVEPFDTPAICALCHRILTPENDPIDLDSITICGDCKFLFLEDNGTPLRQVTRMTPRIRRTRHNYSSESIEDMFSHQFSTMINLARHNPPPVSDTSSRTTPSGSRRWRRVVSDTESEGFDSVYGEIDVVSYDAGGDSDASVDVGSFLGGDSDTDDIDPMHAGRNQWSSDEEDDEWEEVDGENENGNTLGSLIARVQLQRSTDQSSEIESSIRVRISERRRFVGRNMFGNIDNQERSPYVGNAGDYLDARSFEELLERLAEADNSRRGAPPAAVSVVNNLERVVVDEVEYNGVVCAICKDSLTVGTVVNQLPCTHLYHPMCIKPWLSARNTCPLCRFELPTDDTEYENRKQSHSHGSAVQEVQHQEDDTSNEEHNGQEILNNDSGGGDSGGRRWLFVAAPVVSLVGIGLALWLGNPGAIRSSGFCGSSQRGNRSRRWWGLF